MTCLWKITRFACRIPGLRSSASRDSPRGSRRMTQPGTQDSRFAFSGRRRLQHVERVVAVVYAHHVLAQYLRACRFRQLVRQLFELLHVISGMVGMREVGCPEELVRSAQLHHRGQRMLVGVGRNPNVALEVEARTLLELDRSSDDAVVYRVHPVEPVADPSGADFQDNELELRKAVERSELEETRQTVTHGVRCGDVQEKCPAAQMLVLVTSGQRPDWF